jgi:penicillin-binding protein 2
MNDVVTKGTARGAALPGINVCAKTGTAENYRVLDGKRTKLKDNSLFVCFAPMEDPKIAIAVIVENAGYGSTWAGPIAAIMMEKYLNDTLREETKKKIEYVASTDLMPGWLVREQYKADSTRAWYWFKLTKDSSYIKKYIRRGGSAPQQPKRNPPVPVRTAFHNKAEAIDPRTTIYINRKRLV